MGLSRYGIWLTIAIGLSKPAQAGDNIELPTYTNRFSQYDELYTGKASFRCSFRDARSLADDGKLGQGDAGATWFRDHYNNFDFDASSGQFTVQGETVRWNVVRQGSSGDDLIAHLPGGDPLYNLLRIRVWRKPIAFWMTDGTDIFTGQCDRLR